MYRSAAILCLLAMLGGCATITRGTKEVLVIESDPIGANVSTSTGLTGMTPATFKVSHRENLTVSITKEGYEPVTVQVNSQICGAGGAGMAGNVLLGGLIGAAVDAGTGAMYTLKPNPVQVKLNPLQDTGVMTDEATAVAPLLPSPADPEGPAAAQKVDAPTE